MPAFRSTLAAVICAGTAIAQRPPNQETGSKVCAGCHAEIYQKYALTGMARSSGRTAGDVFTASLERAVFQRSGADYQVSPTPKGYRLDFSRKTTAVEGHRMLDWFVGSGGLGRSYIFSVDGLLFQSPVSYYSIARKWDISPGYQRQPNIDLTRPVETACLQCHASRLQPIAGTQNRFASPPFLEGGISCERCHGPGRHHVSRMTAGDRKGPPEIVNPAKLDAARRDSICAQCHLTGAARIARIRRTRDSYRAGELLSDYLGIFVWPDAVSPGPGATSHYERLAASTCKKASGDRLWCGSCHDPHEQPPARGITAHYRNRCQSCHEAHGCKETQPARQKIGDDCVACHMPKRDTRTVEHVMFTDHSIPRRAKAAPESVSERRLLASFWKAAADERDFALAYAVVAPAEPAVRRTAIELLEKAASRNPTDTPVLSQLAQFYDRMGEEEKAMVLCERIVQADAGNAAAAVNLAIYRIKRGRTAEAMSLWRQALTRNPALTGARVNLAVAEFQSGDSAGAESTLVEALKYDPDSEAARKLLAEVRAARR